MGVLGESGASGGGVAHRGRFLELDLDAAASGVFDGLLGLVVEAVVLQAAAGRPHGGGVGHEQGPARPNRLTGGRGLGARGARWRAASIVCGLGGWRRVCTCVCERDSVFGRTREGNARERDQGRNVLAF